MVRERLTHRRWTAAAGLIAAFALVGACGPGEQQPASSAAPAASSALTLPARKGMQPMAKLAELAQPAPADQASSLVIFGCQLRALSDPRPRCYIPQQMWKAYGMTDMFAAGYDGTGQTIVVLDAFGSPTALQDLQAFSSLFGLPAPNLTIIEPQGAIDWSPSNPDIGNQLGWAEETSLDLQWVHALAPGARIVLVAAKDNSDDALAGAFKYILDHNLGSIVSESFGEAEYWLATEPGTPTLNAWETQYRRAASMHVSVFASSGDQGVATEDWTYAMPSYPATSPWVTGVGGTQLNADIDGNYIGERVWNEYSLGIGAGGGGVSTYFVEPVWQWGLPKSIQNQLHFKRAVPDVAYNAAVFGGVIVRIGFLDTYLGEGKGNGWYIFGGTSAGAPQWAAITAASNQAAGRALGFMNPRLYFLGSTGVMKQLNLLHDVTVGDISWGSVPGPHAGPGYDLATGWGTPNFGKLLSKLALLPDNPR